MKIRLFSLLLVAILSIPALTGCQARQRAESAGNTAERGGESAGDTLKTTTETASGQHANPILTLEEAQSIALKHAGLTADQVIALHAEYEIEHGIPQYDVEFHHEFWEYDYEIHADTGEILSFSKED